MCLKIEEALTLLSSDLPGSQNPWGNCGCFVQVYLGGYSYMGENV